VSLCKHHLPRYNYLSICLATCSAIFITSPGRKSSTLIGESEVKPIGFPGVLLAVCYWLLLEDLSIVKCLFVVDVILKYLGKIRSEIPIKKEANDMQSIHNNMRSLLFAIRHVEGRSYVEWNIHLLN
jgi:hypothetical protein